MLVEDFRICPGKPSIVGTAVLTSLIQANGRQTCVDPFCVHSGWTRPGANQPAVSYLLTSDLTTYKIRAIYFCLMWRLPKQMKGNTSGPDWLGARAKNQARCRLHGLFINTYMWGISVYVFHHYRFIERGIMGVMLLIYSSFKNSGLIAANRLLWSS